MNNKYSIPILGLVLIISGSLGFYVYHTYSQNLANNPTNNARNVEAHNFMGEAIDISMSTVGTPDYDKAISLLEKSLEANEGTLAEGYIKTQLALNTHLTKEIAHIGNVEEEHEEEEWVSIPVLNALKEVALNPSYAPGARSLAYYEMADLLLNHLNKKVLGDKEIGTVFSGPFAELAKEGDVYLAIAGLYDLSSENPSSSDDIAISLIPGAISSYKSANIFLEKILMDENLSADGQKAYYDRAQRRIERGNRIFDRFKSAIENTSPEKRAERMDDEYRGVGYIIRAKAEALGKLYLLDPKRTDVSTSEIEAGFEEALSTVTKSRSFAVRRMEMYVRFEYAHWLVEAYGDDASEKIQTILGPLYLDGDANIVVRVHAKNQVGLLAHNTFEARGLILLSRIDSRFKELIMQNDWTEQMLSKKLNPLIQRSF